ncbi:hypothetical protein PYW07_006406 [Mythimna separata]|uniref:Cyclin-dependent kinase inhibitor domain-containing protein n=1 Tax=Mythimna separata TaxID=271217 RepID=A0AAD7YUN5_MYTSE|nr:hypothetical protein PYW07_006406 [Mythimna separata]
MNQRKMTFERRIPKNNKVARRLDFGEVDQAATENYRNKIKEQEEELSMKMTEKYNFDFKNEVALRGNYLWMNLSEGEWVNMEVKELAEVNANERTPMQSRTAADRVPQRRRKMPRDDKGIENSHAKKRLTME